MNQDCIQRNYPEISFGDVFWITGLPGAGKTTLSKCLYAILKKEKSNVVLLDGDRLRQILDKVNAYSLEERRSLSLQYGKLCQLLSSQGVDVICATVSMFHECREWNRSNIPYYYEVYLRLSMGELNKRDQKGLYTGFQKKKNSNMIGLDLPFEEPIKPDLIFEHLDENLLIEACYQILNKRKSK